MYLLVGLIGGFDYNSKNRYRINGIKLYDFESKCELDLDIKDIDKVNDSIIGLNDDFRENALSSKSITYHRYTGILKIDKKYECYIGSITVFIGNSCDNRVYMLNISVGTNNSIQLVYRYKTKDIVFAVKGFDIDTGERLDIPNVFGVNSLDSDNNALLLNYLKENKILKHSHFRKDMVSYLNYFIFHKYKELDGAQNIVIPETCRIFEFNPSNTGSKAEIDKVIFQSGIRKIVLTSGLNKILKTGIYFSENTDTMVLQMFLCDLFKYFELSFNEFSGEWVLDVPTGISKVIDKAKLVEFKDTFIECINIIREENKLSLSVIKEIVEVMNSVGFNINFY